MKRAPFAHVALHPDASLHQPHQFGRDGQPETGAAVLASGRRVPLLESLKHFVELLSRNADAGVPHGEVQADLVVAPPLFRHRDDDFTLLRELDGVADQVQQDLTQLRRIAAHDGRQVGRRPAIVSSSSFC